MDFPTHFDVIVIGGGHAGTEAALASARLGADTLLLTHNIDTIGQMSCNPAIGGIGKGHLVKEIDALGGIMAKAIDRAGIQFRTLNARKGPAVQATRAQADRQLYRQAIRQAVEQQANLTLFQQAVDDLIIDNDCITGVITQMGVRFYAKAVVLTVGTFLGGKIHIGEQQSLAGRAGDPPATVLAQRLRARPFRVGRLKTGTPPRIDKRSINWSAVSVQPGDTPIPSFAFDSDGTEHPKQIDCHITYTNPQTHELIRHALHRSPIYQGVIEGVGPRYCPSIEDKVVRFAGRDNHQIFIEPEGLTSNEIYPNGISTSLPFDVQLAFVHSIVGFEQAHITRPGYAIEYDFFDPRDLKPSLETQYIQGLFFAGQINGTTGYEEAAAQGLIAGLNAARQVASEPSWTPRRDQAYIGVLIDDLITQGTLEPYRMFTSRAEYRLVLREDNADLRLSVPAFDLGLIDAERAQQCQDKAAAINQEIQRLKNHWLQPGTASADALATLLSKPLAHEYSLWDLLRRPELTYSQLAALDTLAFPSLSSQVSKQVQIQAKYCGYLARAQAEIDQFRAQEQVQLPKDMDYASINGLSNEIKEKLTQQQPATLGQAGRIPGVTPAAIALLVIYLKKRSAHAA